MYVNDNIPKLNNITRTAKLSLQKKDTQAIIKVQLLISLHYSFII